MVTYRHSTLAEAPGNETQTRLNLIAAYDDIIVSTELTNVVLSTRKLTEVVEMIKSKIDNILLINYIPGRCDVCRRLGL